jgi:TetR/AcrR family transcriptional regulator, transcriptional repressor for nem operon
MRYTKEHAEEVRRRLISEGGRQIKELGVLGAGVDGIARALGLTGAALYSHFESKEALLSAILAEELGETARRLVAGHASVDTIFKRYLSLSHSRAPARGCALPAITSDIGRGSAELRAAFAAGFSEVVDAVDQQLGNRELALGMLATAVGAVALARALPSDAGATELLAAAQTLIASSLSASAPPAVSGGSRRKPRAAKKLTKRAQAPARKKR